MSIKKLNTPRLLIRFPVHQIHWNRPVFISLFSDSVPSALSAFKSFRSNRKQY